MSWRSLKSIRTKLSQLPLLQNFSWMMVSEVLSRSSRFVTLFVLAAYFSNAQYGLAMLALAIHELMRVITRLGTGAKIIQCSEQDLPVLLRNAATLNWLVAIGVAFCQIALADLIAAFYDAEELSLLLKLMALSHLLYPLVAIRIFEQLRQNKMRYYGIASGLSIAFENLLVAAIVLFHAQVVAVALAKIAAAAFWVILFWRLPSQLTVCEWNWRHQKALLSFSMKTLTSELSRMLRFQADSLIAGKLLSPEAFGLYSFAKSAGLGIAQSISQAYLSALYPYLCRQARAAKNATLNKPFNTWWATVGLSLCFVIQVILAPFYIEWLFSERWNEAGYIAAILCLIAIPTVLVDHLGLSYRAKNRATTEMKITLFCTTVIITGLLYIEPTTVLSTAILMASCSAVWLLVFVTQISNWKQIDGAQTSPNEHVKFRFPTRFQTQVKPD